MHETNFINGIRLENLKNNSGLLSINSAGVVLVDISGGNYVLKSGDTITGALVINQNGSTLPTAPIGTALYVCGNNATPISRVTNESFTGNITGSTGGYTSFTGVVARGTPSSPLPLQSGDEITHLSAAGYAGSGTGFTTARGYISIFAAEDWTNSAQGTRVGILTTSPGTSSTSEKIRIWGDGGISTRDYSAPTGTAYVSGGQAYVYGVGTNFTKCARINDTITIGGQTRTITLVNGDTLLTVSSNFSPSVPTTTFIISNMSPSGVDIASNVTVDTASPFKVSGGWRTLIVTSAVVSGNGLVIKTATPHGLTNPYAGNNTWQQVVVTGLVPTNLNPPDVCRVQTIVDAYTILTYVYGWYPSGVYTGGGWMQVVGQPLALISPPNAPFSASPGLSNGNTWSQNGTALGISIPPNNGMTALEIKNNGTTVFDIQGNGRLDLASNAGLTWFNGDGNWAAGQSSVIGLTTTMVGTVQFCGYPSAGGGYAFGGKNGNSTLEIETAGGNNPRVYARGPIGIGIVPVAATAQLSVQTNAATVKGITIQGAVNQSANLIETQNSSGTTLFKVDPTGSITSTAISGTNGNIVTHDANGKLLDSGVAVSSISGYVLKSGDTMTGNLGIGVAPTANLSLYNSGNSGNLVLADLSTAYNGLAAQLIASVGSNQNLVGFNFPGVSNAAANWFSIRFNSSSSKTWWGCYTSPAGTSLTHQQTPTQSFAWTTNLGIPSTTLAMPHMVLYTPPSGLGLGTIQSDAQLGINSGYIPAGTLDVIATLADTINISGSGNTLVGTTVTLTTTTPHNLQTGATVNVGLINSSIAPNNTWNASGVTITVLSAYTFSYTNATATGTYVSGGYIFPTTKTTAIAATHGILDIGPAVTSFDGTTLGCFSGSASGTYFAINASNVFNGNFIDIQKNGVSRYIIDSLGTTIVPSVSGVGIKVDTVNPTYGWRDIIGQIIPDTGPTAPAKGTFRGGTIGMYSFTDGDQTDIPFHMPHDYALGTDIFVHVHWSHNGTSISNNAVFTLTATTAKGFNQAIYSAEKAQTITYNTVNIATTPRYIHRIDEIQLSNKGGTGNLLDTNAIEVDSLILINFTMTTNPTIGGGSPNEVYVMQIDIHYQSTGIPTKNKSPNFYGTTS